jgi:hypothetical protein
MENLKQDRRHAKVGGWLLLFAITLLVFNPAMKLVGILGSFGPVAAIASKYPRFSAIYAALFAIDVAMMVWSIAAGVALLRARPYAVRLAKLFLIVNPLLLFGAAVALGSSDLPAKARDAMNMEGAKQVSRTIVYGIIWGLYLARSRRVKETFAPPVTASRTSSELPARKVASA